MSDPGHEDGLKLARVLGPWTAICVIVGSVIGSGIFLVPSTVAINAPSIGGIALVWLIGGLFSLAGALSLSELGAMLPRAGGPYVYLRAAYGPTTAFLFGWTEFLVVRSGSMAALAAAFARYFSRLVPAPAGVRIEIWQAILAVSAIAILATINVRGTKPAGNVQVIGTGIKLGALATMIALPFALGKADFGLWTPLVPARFNMTAFEGMMAAMVAVLWAYDGWVNLTPLAEEIQEPERNIPRALIGGMFVLIVIYLGMTLAYHLVLPLDRIAADRSSGGAERPPVAFDYCNMLLGRSGSIAIAFVVSASTFISLNGNALCGPRTYFAMARDGIFPARLARIHRRFGTPATAITAQASWASALTIASTLLIVVDPPKAGLPPPLLAFWTAAHKMPLYDLMYGYVIFGATIFYALCVSAVFVLRVRRPELDRPCRAWGYPFTPALYLVASAILTISMLRKNPVEAFSGLAIVALGFPAYLAFCGRSGSKTIEY